MRYFSRVYASKIKKDIALMFNNTQLGENDFLLCKSIGNNLVHKKRTKRDHRLFFVVRITIPTC